VSVVSLQGQGGGNWGGGDGARAADAAAAAAARAPRPLPAPPPRFCSFNGLASTPCKCFCKKSMSKTFPKKIDKNFDVSSPSICFWFYRVFGCFLAISDVFAKEIASKSFTKNST
jgi:hypothetical protein